VNGAASIVKLGWKLRVDVTPHVSKPHDYVNHMFKRLLSVDEVFQILD
jgi:hypothetical protein